MQKKLRSLLSLAVVLVLALVLMGVRQANALSSGDWNTVADTVDAYITAMDAQCPNSNVSDIGTCRDEEIFFSTAVKVRALLNSNGDSTLLGVGDNMANKPVLVDNLCNLTTLIPGTAYRFVDNLGACSNGWYYAANTTNTTAVRARVEKYYEAGFSTDVHIY